MLHITPQTKSALRPPSLLGRTSAAASSATALHAARARKHVARRGGQALLLAVLLMVFAALLGSTFMTIVSSNLNHTTRQGGLASAGQSAQAGIAFVNDRLTNSPQGTGWRPWQILASPPPKPGDSDFNTYFSAQERAYGWINEVDFSNVPPGSDLNANGISYSEAARRSNRPEQDAEIQLWAEAQMSGASGSPSKRCFVKIPDPRGAATNANGAQFLAEVRPEIRAGTPTGLLKITVIGQSEESPNAFEMRGALKPAQSQSPLFTSARTISNWDFGSNTVPEAQVVSQSGTDLTIGKQRGSFPAAPFYVTIGGLNTPLQTALVTQVTSATQLRLKDAIAPVAGDRVQLASALGAPAGVDLDADGAIQGTSTDASGRRVLYSREAVAFSPSETPGAAPYTAARVNGGLVLMGNALLRRDAGAAVSGLIALRDVPSGDRALPRAIDFQGANARLTDSASPSFPIFQGQDENGSAINQAQAQSRIRDGRDYLRNIPNTLRNVTNFVPPTIDAARYRELTKYSAPNVNIVGYGSNPSGGPGALFGYGEGVYIDNGSDREKATTLAGGISGRSMTASQLRQMLYGKASSTLGAAPSLDTAFQRACRPYGVGQKESSSYVPTLEQKHQRGWIGPDEFRARGALIELAPREVYSSGAGDERTIYVTLDALSDGGPAGDGLDVDQPDPQKSYRLADGTLPTDARRYRRRLPWPQDGVVFAEGNVRVRGGAFGSDGRADAAVDPHRGLTIVTMGNAYIEGSLNAGARKLAILARQNVILNPTAIVSRLEAQTKIIARAGTPRGSVVTVDDSALFQVGDWVEVNNGGPYRVTSTAPASISDPASPASVGLSPAYTGTAISPILRAIQDPLFATGISAIPYFGPAVRLGKASDMVQRRFPLLPGASSVRLTLRHSAFRRPAFQVRADRTLGGPALPPDTIELSSKLIASADAQTTVIPAASKYLQADWSTGGVAGTPDRFSNAAPSSAADLKGNLLFRLGVTTPTNGIEKQIEDSSASHAAQAWSYNTTETKPLGSFDSAAGAASPLWFFVAASANRHTFGYSPSEALHRKQSIKDAAASLSMGTSITAFFNAGAAPATITSDHFNPSTRAFDEKVTQLGFNSQLDGTEDALTTDDTFHTSYVGATTLPTPAPRNGPELISLDFDTTDYTLDSRTFDIAAPAPGGQNTLALTMNNQTIKLNGTGAAAADTGQTQDDFFQKSRATIPYYRLSRLKLDTPSSAAAPVFDASGQLAKIEPGATMEVQAFVMAQEGSWMVIAGDFYDSTLGTDASGSFVTRPNATRAGIDLDRDGVVTRDERTSVYRLRRYNYKILFRGAIMENVAMPVVAESGEPGAVGEWMDKWAACRFSAAQGDFDDAQRDGIAASTSAARLSQAQAPLNDANASASFGNITYEFDASLSNPAALADTGLRAPPSPELTSVS